MNKKILFGIFLVSLFILSTASMVQPVHGYKWGVPKQAIGVTSESEIKVYDKKEFDKRLGGGVDTNTLVEGDSDKLGAKSKSKYLEMETDEDLIDFEADRVYAAAGFDAAYPDIQGALWALAILYASTEIPPITYIINATTDPTCAALAAGYPELAGILTPLAGAGDQAELLSLMSVIDYADAMGIFGDSYDGSILTRDKWDYTDKDYKEKADVKKDEVPFLADPRDWYHSYLNVEAFGAYITGTIDNILAQLDTWLYLANQNITVVKATLNAQLSAALNVDATLKATVAALGAADPTGHVYVLGCYVLNYFVLGQVRQEVAALIPDKFNYLWQLLWAGLPTYVPQKDFLARMLKEFDAEDDFDGDHLYGVAYLSYGKDIMDGQGNLVPDGEVSGIPLGAVITSPLIGDIPLPGETVYIYAYPKLELIDSTISIKIEYQDNQLDPADMSIFGGTNEDELKDWTAEFPYGDTGSQGTISCKAGDTVFWQWGGVEQIPGYELTIILGASALSIIGIIFVLMKKRKM